MNRSCYVSHHCPQCGGEVVFDQEATGTRCRYCGAGLMIMGTGATWLNFLIKPRISVKETAHEVTRIAMKNGWKPPLLRSVIPFYYPFYRTTGHAIKWVRGHKPKPGGNSELQERVITRPIDLMRPAHTDLSPGLFSPGYRVQALNLYLATRENAGKLPFAPIQKDKETHSLKMQKDFFDGMPDHGLKLTQEKRFRLWEKNSILFFPLSLVEVREGSHIRLLLIDSVGGGLIRQLSHEEMEELLENLGLKESRSPGETRLKLAPLICPECAGELDPDPVVHLRLCRSCGRGWEARRGEMKQKECLWTGDPLSARDPATLFMPFWLRRGEAGSVFIPAFKVRSPRLLYNLSARYYHADFPVRPIPDLDRLKLKPFPVSLPPDGADEMADVIADTGSKKPFGRKGTTQSIVFVPFRKRGPDLVGPKGLAVPVSSLGVKL